MSNKGISKIGSPAGGISRLPALDPGESNVDIIPAVDVAFNLGSAAKKWFAGFFKSIVFDEHNDPATPAAGDLRVFDHSLNKTIASVDEYGDIKKYAGGTLGLAQSIALTTSAQNIVLKTVNANALGTTGQTITEANFDYLNNSSATRTLSVTYDFGGYTITFSNNIGANATNRSRFFLRIVTVNNQANNAQHHLIEFKFSSVLAAATLGGYASANQAAWDTSSVDTSSGFTVDVTVLSSANNVTQTIIGNGFILQWYGA